MNEAATLLIERLAAAAATGSPVDMHALLGNMTMQVVGTSAFGCAIQQPSLQSGLVVSKLNPHTSAQGSSGLPCLLTSTWQ